MLTKKHYSLSIPDRHLQSFFFEQQDGLQHGDLQQVGQLLAQLRDPMWDKFNLSSKKFNNCGTDSI